ncbi:camphor resistance protein CrcB [Staphylococcus piscifermentans]|uniref:Fluoride-specific ion channel FluC n=1 Tax=Staphylococcus piscifermentans TaxID=70258 RepID=A0A239TYF0_9STAP|nr:fluoride efflux transporter CrcB [Staphylococcus piscifermentans]RTX86860.1 fluoride efflux transporter CrcB [Staphylococcus piscifermentans]GEP84381.1 putative fluoride ion transporter CrcB 1 [Staphylococcus piscifermentans]SNV02961.1 camphor resistance protein CrcB [Staphylococcus piscifermentans]
MQYLYVFIGGAFGALIRFLLSQLNHSDGFPTGTFLANLAGAFLMGFFTALILKLFQNNPLFKKGITTGFLGALTTFSSFQFELVHMLEQHHYLLLGIYAVTSYILGILLCYLGGKLGGALSHD